MKRLLVILAISGFFACASGQNLDVQGVQDVLSNPMVGQSLAFALCPPEFRTVAVVNGKTELGCASAPVESLQCPAGQVLVGVKVVNPTSSDRKVEAVCENVPVTTPATSTVTPAQ